jgi:hypothetical protein
MDAAPLTAIVTGASTLGGVAIGGVIDGVRSRLERRERERDELERRLAAFLTALNDLEVELRALPKQGRRSKLVNQWLASRAPSVDFFFGQLARFLLGRPLYAAMSAFQRAANSLVLAMPREILFALEQVGERMGDFEDRGPEFFDRLQAAKEDLLVVGRLAVLGELDPPRRRRWWRSVRRRTPRSELPAEIAKRAADRPPPR